MNSTDTTEATADGPDIQRIAGGQPTRAAALAHPLFEEVDPGRVAHLLRRLQPLTVARGTILVGGAFRRRATYLVLSGVLHPFVLSGDGRRLILEVVGAGGYDGLLVASGREGHLCEAATDAVVVPVTMELLHELITAEPIIGLNLLDLTLTRLERREAHMLGMAHGEALRRIAHQLLALGSYAGVRVGEWVELSPRPTHQILSEMVGVRRETMTLQLNTLRRLRAVKVDAKAMRLNIPLLKRLTDHPLLARTELGTERNS